MTIKEASHLIKLSIQDIHDPREVNAITEWILEDLTGLTRVDRLLSDSIFSNEQETQLNSYLEKLKTAMPVQYVTGYAWFMGKKLRVDENVLIPRPETEELVEWTLESLRPGMKAVDIGTGSGCIPVLLKHLQPEAEIFGVDVSNGALELAKKNAAAFGASIQFIEQDILDETTCNSLPIFNIIVSNPPYIPFKDKESMDKHVVEHEPHLALFVPEEDPLVFYRAILEWAKKHLTTKGKIFFETHHALAKEVAALTTWPAEIRKDQFGKERMVCISKP